MDSKFPSQKIKSVQLTVRGSAELSKTKDSLHSDISAYVHSEAETDSVQGNGAHFGGQFDTTCVDTGSESTSAGDDSSSSSAEASVQTTSEYSKSDLVQQPTLVVKLTSL